MADFAFDAILFDLDATLVCFDPYWPDVARIATIRLFETLDIKEAIPTAAEWTSLLGRPLPEIIDAVFGHLGSPEVIEAQAIFLEEMHVARNRGPAFRTGAEEAFAALKEREVLLGLMYDSGPLELETLQVVLELERRMDEICSHESHEISNKAILIERLTRTFGTRSVAVVGATLEDRNATWSNGHPYVHVPSDLKTLRDGIIAEATLDGFDQLVEALSHRDVVLRQLLALLRGARTVAVIGPTHAGKTLAARDLARLARERGERSEAIQGPSEINLALSAKVERLFVVLQSTAGPSCDWPYDATINLVATNDVVARRAATHPRTTSTEPYTEEWQNVAPRKATAARPAFVVDMTNPISPRIL